MFVLNVCPNSIVMLGRFAKYREKGWRNKIINIRLELLIQNLAKKKRTKVCTRDFKMKISKKITKRQKKVPER